MMGWRWGGSVREGDEGEMGLLDFDGKIRGLRSLRGGERDKRRAEGEGRSTRRVVSSFFFLLGRHPVSSAQTSAKMRFTASFARLAVSLFALVALGTSAALHTILLISTDDPRDD